MDSKALRMQRVALAAAVWACAVTFLSLALISSEGPGADRASPVVLSAFFPGDDFETDLQDDQQVGRARVSLKNANTIQAVFVP
jgi:hypothetical protein